MNIDNNMIKKQLEHRTIRKFKDEPIPAEIFEQIVILQKKIIV